jgi:nicotinic acid phosphoribosyltransferase
MVMYALEKLAAAWGTTENALGYKVLNGNAVIQGDGMDYNKIIRLYEEIIANKFSPQNVAVGMGGGLLQKLNRDDMSWSMKCYQAQINGNWINIMKNPKTDQSKKAWNPSNGINIQDYQTYYRFEPGMDKPEILPPTAEYFRKVREYARA